MLSKNVVFVLNEYNGHGGAQRVASILADDFSADGHKVSILSINEQKNASSYFSNDIPVKVLHRDNYRAPLPIAISPNLKSGKYKKVFSELRRRRMLKKKRKEVIDFFNFFRNEEVFVIVIQVYGMQWLQPLIYNNNVKLIGQSHESYIASKSSNRYKRILKYYRQVSRFLLLTRKDKEYFYTQGFKNADYIYNPTPFRNAPTSEKLYNNRTLISTGRLVENKGFDVLIEAFSRVSRDIPDWKLYIYGDGPAKESLQTLIGILGMEEKVFLKGQIEDIETVLTNSSLFVLSSKAEGLPMSLIEAQSCGLPCISTDCAPGIREIIKEYENGYITPVNDVDLISRHIRRIALNKELYKEFSQNAFNSSEKFDRHVIKQQWYELFKELGEEIR
ncbi:glycosyltransferase [Virgibacillus halodenitrificans]|uniref:glycosyltransferase n=1 Tax=Virgibacillus halodenitrificans TaxID=1482 RepID=UPI0013700CA1|nr:glycosyltransferase [Virgibacillus halodenitrificans]MYL47791.1 glycosyltransferase [Virgibacillus halodenitrificans]